MPNNANIFRILLVLSLLVGGCTSGARYPATDDTQVIRIKGSDTLLRLTQMWAQVYMQNYKNTSIYVEGGGTATGVKALINGEVNICMASRPLKPNEVKQLVEQYNRLGMAFRAAKEAIAIYIHPENPIENLTLEQVKNIFLGEIKNWSEVGGPELEISVLTRSFNSGTHLYFKEHVLGGEEYTTDATIVSSYANMVKSASENPAAISYGSIIFGENLKSPSIDGVLPTERTIRSDKYPISRYLYLYTIRQPGGATKHFLDWVMRRDGQRVVQQAGYLPIVEIQ